MDINVLYQGQQYLVQNASDYQDLAKKIQILFPILQNFHFTYQNEQGEIFKVSNTNDLTNIDLKKTILSLKTENADQVISEQKLREQLEQKEMIIDQQRMLEETIMEKKEELEMMKLELAQITIDFQSQITLLKEKQQEIQKQIIANQDANNQVEHQKASELIQLEILDKEKELNQLVDLLKQRLIQSEEEIEQMYEEIDNLQAML